MATVEEKAKELLKLQMTGAIQILECVERPGAITISWDEVTHYFMMCLYLTNVWLLKIS